MTPQRWEQIQQSFDRVAKLPADQRQRELEKIGAVDAELCREVEALLKAEQRIDARPEPALAGASRSSASVSRRDRVGQTISHYRVESRLGGGGMGVVYKAQDLRLDRYVALKFLPPNVDDDDERLKRLIVEARAASALDHPNICTIHQIDQTSDGHWFIVMAYYPGDTLKKRIEGSPLPIEDVLDLGIQVGRGLAKAHKEGIVHRDLKPANVMVTDEGVVKIVDFGLAQLVAETKLTAPGTRLGTPAYMSPEQAQGQPLDHRTDVWALGVVLYEMLTGRPPFKGDYELAVIYSIVNEEPTAVSQLRPDIPKDLAQVVEKALSKDPAGRYQQVEELVNDLVALKGNHASGEATLVAPPPAAPKRKGLTYAGVAAAAALLLAIFLTRTPPAAQDGSEGAAAPPPIAAPIESAPSSVAPVAEPAEAPPVSSVPPPGLAGGTPAPSQPAAPAASPPSAKAANQESQQQQPAVPAEPVRTLPPQNQRWALIIGVERYVDAGITPFRGAERDAGALAEALVQYAGFPKDQVIVLSSSESGLRAATRANIDSYLQNVTRLVPREGLLLFCFLGHAANSGGEPVLMPADARLNNTAGTAIRLGSVRDAVRQRGIRQAVVFLDAFRQSPRASQRGTANPMNAAYSQGLALDAARREVDAFAALYAATPGERAYEQPSTGSGYFVSVLIEGLQGAAADSNGRVTLGALERYVRTVVPKRVLGELGASSVQRPFAQVQGYVSDEVVIATAARREVAAAVLPGQRQETPQNPQAQELAEWTRIRDSNDLRVFEAFLRAYPDGSLRRDALLRVEDLKWAAARDAKDVAAIEGYLREYPQGRHAAESKTLLGQLRPPAPAPAAAPAATPAPPPASRPPAEADAIREILRQYGEAYRTRNTQRIAELWPTLTAEQLRQFSSYFQDLVTIEYELAPLAEPEIRGETATVRCQQSSRFVDNRRTERSAQDVVNVVLRKRQGAWRIDALQSEGRGP